MNRVNTRRLFNKRSRFQREHEPQTGSASQHGDCHHLLLNTICASGGSSWCRLRRHGADRCRRVPRQSRAQMPSAHIRIERMELPSLCNDRSGATGRDSIPCSGRGLQSNAGRIARTAAPLETRGDRHRRGQRRQLVMQDGETRPRRCGGHVEIGGVDRSCVRMNWKTQLGFLPAICNFIDA